MSSSEAKKRKGVDAPISPPPLKRALKSDTTKSAVANFFTPTSQKPREGSMRWTERSANDDTPTTLLVGKYRPEQHAEKKEDAGTRRKIAAFDLDSTLITTSSGKRFASSATDWRWWDSRVPGRLRELHDQGYQIAIFSNQAAVQLHVDPKGKRPKAQQQPKRAEEFKQKCKELLTALNLPTTLYAATERDSYRKPRTGMWDELCNDYGLSEKGWDAGGSFFVGDAGGRTALPGGAARTKDFGCSDRDFAHNIGIKFFTPEEFFLGETPRAFAREFDLAHFPFLQDDVKEIGGLFEKKNEQDVVVFCGPPGAGKSTFYWRALKPLGYQRVNQDALKSRDKCMQAARDLLAEGHSIAIGIDTRAHWVELARSAKVPIRCVWFSTPLVVCEHNDAVRSLNTSLNPEKRPSLPRVAFTSFASRFQRPRKDEGFEDVTEIKFGFRGTQDEYTIWGRYWN